MPAPQLAELGAVAGDWLFKQGDMLLGPVPAKVLMDKLYRGEITGSTPVARDGQENFAPLESIEIFKLHAKKAQVKVQVDTESVNLKVQQSRSRMLKLGGFAALGAVVLGGGAYGAYWLAVNKPWRDPNDADLIAINVEVPTISLASAAPDELAVAIHDPASPAPQPSPGGAHHPAPPAHPKGHAPTPGPGPQNAADPDGMVSKQQFDSSAISQIAQQKASSIYPCIKTEAIAHPPTDQVNLPLEFTVGNDGHIAKLWVDNRDFGEGTALYACLSKTLKTWSFPHYEGEQANVKLKFSWGPKH